MAAQIAGVFFAGGIGATLRVLLSGRVEASLAERLPHAGVLVANLIGCLLIGFGSAAISSPHWRTIVLGGLLGGFTTYSAFALFSVDLLTNGRLGVLAAQISAHLLGGVLAVFAGIWLARSFGFVVSS